ncbi:MAG: DUF4136 domain-containing protein [Halieaceae bacterium]
MGWPEKSKKLLMLALVLGLAACTSFIPPRPAIDYKRGYDFDRVQKFAMAPHDTDACFASGLTLEEAALIDKALVAALRQQGFTVVDDASQSDVVVDWHVVTEEVTDARPYNASSYYQCWRCGPAISDVSVIEYTMGTFIVDLIDPELSKSVWRAVIKGRLPPKPDTAERQSRYDAAALDIFSRFPPGILPDLF